MSISLPPGQVFDDLGADIVGEIAQFIYSLDLLHKVFFRCDPLRGLRSPLLLLISTRILLTIAFQLLSVFKS